MQSALSLHISRKHRQEEDVSKALELPKKKRLGAFASFKRSGIKMHNIKETAKTNPSYQKERKFNGNELPIMCSTCQAFISKRSISRHAKSCNKSFKIDLPILSSPDTQFSDNFKKHILSTIRNDEIGTLVKTDRALLLFGSNDFQKSLKNPQKVFSTRVSVRRNMRELAKLYTIFLKQSPKVVFVNAKDMFTVQNFDHLRESIKIYGQKGENDIKGGAKVNLQYTIINAAKCFKAYAHVGEDEESVSIFERFLTTFKIFENVIFGDARYKNDLSKKRKLRLPTELPMEEDMQTFQQETIRIVANVDKEDYIKIRDAACARVTLYNGRRYINFVKPSLLYFTKILQS